MSLKRILKEWTLPVAMAAGVLGYVALSRVPWLRPVGVWYAPLNAGVLPVCSFVVLYVTFCKIRFRGLRVVAWHWRLAVLQLACVAALMLAALCVGDRGPWAILLQATLVCVLSPCATAAAVVTQKLGGSVEEMTTYTLLSNVISSLLIPACFMMLPHHAAAVSGGAAEFLRLFAAMLTKVSSILVLPMVLAALTKRCLPRAHAYIIKVRDLSFYLWAVALVIVTATTVRNIDAARSTTPAPLLLGIAGGALLVCAAQFALGRRYGRAIGKRVEAGQGLGQKNTTFGIWAATAFLDPLSCVGPGCYILWQNIANSAELRRHQRQNVTKSG